MPPEGVQSHSLTPRGLPQRDAALRLRGQQSQEERCRDEELGLVVSSVSAAYEVMVSMGVHTAG